MTNGIKDDLHASYKTTEDLAGVNRNFVTHFGGDNDALSYAWGWYWWLTKKDNADYLTQAPGPLIPELIQMGFDDAKGTYEQ